jgi:hypothetical protein
MSPEWSVTLVSGYSRRFALIHGVAKGFSGAAIAFGSA